MLEAPPALRGSCFGHSLALGDPNGDGQQDLVSSCDLLVNSLAGVLDVSDGAYTLRVSVDQNDVIDEDGVHPNTVTVPLRLSGDTVEFLQ